MPTDAAALPDAAPAPAAGAPGRMKEWAKAHMRGLETILLPSFTPDMKALDAEGIRHDVRMCKRHGWFSAFCPSVGLSPQEHLEFVRIAAEEAGSELAVSLSIGFENDADPVEQMKRAADCGASHALVHTPFHWKPADGTELEQWYRRIIEAAPVATVLWATDGPNFRHFAFGNVPTDVIDRLGDLDQVVAVKLMTTLDEAIAFELCERVADRILIGCVNLRQFPLWAKHYGAQWSGAWTGEALQTPDKPYIADYVRQLNAGDWDAALATYKRLAPAYGMLFQMMAPLLPKGAHPFTQLKFYQWFSGGNGGLLRFPTHDTLEADFKLTAEQRAHIARGFAMLGIDPPADPNSFATGRVAFANGGKSSDIDPHAAAMMVA